MSDSKPTRPPILSDRSLDRSLVRTVALAVAAHAFALIVLWWSGGLETLPEKVPEVMEVDLFSRLPEGGMPEGGGPPPTPAPEGDLPDDEFDDAGPEEVEEGEDPADAEEVSPEPTPDGEQLLLILTPTPVPITPSPSPSPSPKPTSTPRPTATPSAKPSPTPTVKPTAVPTAEPTVRPTPKRTPRPTARPTAKPTARPTAKPTAKAPSRRAPVGEKRPGGQGTEEKKQKKSDGQAEKRRSPGLPSVGSPARDKQIQDALDRIRGRVGDGGGSASGTGGGTGAGTGSGGPIGIPGGQGQGEIDPADLEFAAYYNEMIARIRDAWVWGGGRSDLEVRVRFRVTAKGEVADLKLSEGSGDVSYDLSVLRALRSVGRLGPPPERFRKDFEDVELTFQPGDLQ